MTSPLRVLIVEPNSQNHWHYTIAIARALVGRGVEVRVAVIAPYDGGALAGEIPVTVIGGRWVGKASRLLGPAQRLVHHVGKVAGLVRVIREYRPNVVHLHGGLGKLDFAYFGLVRSLGARIVYTAHDLNPLRWCEVSNRLRYHAADLIVVHSSNSVAQLSDAYGIETSKIQELPHASPLPLRQDGAISRQEASAILGLPAGSRAVLFFGDIVPRKGLDVLLDALALLRREQCDVYLIVAGQPRGNFDTYRERIAEHQLSSRVMLDLRSVPFERVRVYFSAADVVALPYREAYQSHVLQWAYAFGRPVVVTDVGGLRDAVAADGTGLIAHEGDREELARNVLALLGDEQLARDMGQRALRLAQTKYSWDAVSEKLAHAYGSMLAGNTTSANLRVSVGVGKRDP